MSPRKNRVLAIDDDPEILKLIKRVLEIEGFQVATYDNGERALQKIEQEPFDLILLDLMMPVMDGINLCMNIRSFSTIPIIILTAKVSNEDKIRGLNIGADDYITKPFSTQELVARVRSVLRRSQMSLPVLSVSRLVSGDLDINFADRRVTVSGEEVKLTPTEFNLLQELAQHSGKVLTHTHLLNHVWGNEYQNELRYLHVFINRLRHKLKLEPLGNQMIETISGIGYRFNRQ